MPKLSLYQQGACIADYQYIDNVVAEMYSVGGLDIFIHKYLGPTASTPHSAADFINCFAKPTLPSWLFPISAIMYVFFTFDHPY